LLLFYQEKSKEETIVASFAYYKNSIKGVLKKLFIHLCTVHEVNRRYTAYLIAANMLLPKTNNYASASVAGQQQPVSLFQ